MKSLRRLALVSAAVAVLGLGMGPMVDDAHADHKWKHRGHHHGPKWDRDRDHDRRWDRDRHDRWDRDRDDRRSSYGYDSEKCAEVARRIDRAHYEIGKWDGTGRHEGVVSWYKGDLENALRDRARYCSGRYSGSDRYRDRWYDHDDRYDDRYYDRYDSGYDRDFDLDRDWPSLLGLFMNNGLQLGY